MNQSTFTSLVRSVAALASTLTVFTASATTFTYSPLVLGGGSTCSYLAVYDVNKSGQVAATCDGVASIWTNNTKMDLLTPSGTRGSETWALNNKGQVIGDSIYGASDANTRHATLWTGSVALDLGTLSGANSRPLGINDAGVVVGRSDLAEAGHWHATRWDGTQITDLGTLGGTNSTAISINNLGTIAGISRITGDLGSHATIWTGSMLTDLGTLGGKNSWANAINDNGWVAGDSDLFGDTTHHALLWNGNAMVDLGTLGGANSYGTDISSDGSVIGFAETASGAAHATLWKDGNAIDLNSFVDKQSSAEGVVLTGALGFDGNGSIYGDQFNSKTKTHGYFFLAASPSEVPEPNSAWLISLALLSMIALKRCCDRPRI